MELKAKTAKQLHIIKLLSCATLLLFSLLLVLYVQDVISNPISAVLVPLFLAVCSVPVSLHLVLCSFSSTINKCTSLSLLVGVYSASASLLVFLLLTGLRIDDVIEVAWAVVFIPLWVGLFWYLMLCVFLCPGLTSGTSQLHRNAFVIFLYGFAALATSILVATKLDLDSPKYWSVCLVPLWTCLALHCLSFGFFKLPPQTKECFTAEKIYLIYAGFELLLVNLILEVPEVPVCLAFLPFWISLGVWLTYIEVDYFSPNTEEADPLLRADSDRTKA
jgi:hypothetical protein